MSAGLEYLFWCVFFALILICWALVELVERPDPLPPPRLDCIDRGPLEHWEAGEGRVRHP